MTRRTRTLSRRLVVALIGLLAATCLVVGTVAVLSLRTYLIGQVDTQLAAAGGRSSTAVADTRDGRRPAPQGLGPVSLLTPGQGAGTLGAQVVSGRVEAAVIDSSGHTKNVPESAEEVLADLPVDGEPRTRTLDGLGDCRLLATRDDGDVVITGLPLGEATAAVYRLAAVVTGVTLLALLLMGLLGVWIVKVALRPLRRVMSTAGQVSRLPLDRVGVSLAVRVPPQDSDPNSEIGQVGAALNHMLGHVDAALTARDASETKLRRFVADASHELRTPLAAIRGYAELTRRDPVPLSPGARHALNRIEAEGVRMSALVDDLLLLARLDAGRSLQSEEVDLSALVIDATSDAHAAAPDRPIHLDVPDEPVVVSGDRAALHQVLSNLLANTRTHTPAGTRVCVTLTVGDAYAGIDVADDGPGVPADVQPVVFERFARADTSRSRTSGSTGLGLAIVAAVVSAHHGRIELSSVPGRTVFAVRLPRVKPALRPQRARGS